MVVTVFRARVRKDLEPALYQEVEKRNARMLELASSMPGFVSYKDFAAADGEMLAIVEFDTLEHVRAWGEQPEHREVQSWGREQLFSEYTIHTAEVARTMRFP
jgi:heme-degrading monooxygenase HmoA